MPRSLSFPFFKINLCNVTESVRARCLRGNMREIDLSANELICAGEDARDLWPLKEKSQLQHLEKKESFCSWFQAKNGTVEDQIPALKVGDKFYSMPMKVQKIIFRHVRLNNAFRNIEHTATGREKLWIPQTLLREKLRTARRFMVSPPRTTYACTPHNGD